MAVSMRRCLVSALLAAQPHNHTRELRYGDGLAPYYVLRAERDMRDRLAQPLTVASLANAAGVSERTLHDGFRRFRATTPMGRLTALRLAAARRRLQDAAPGVTVGRIAIDVGFFQLGRFARIYRNAFGELPSATLQAARRRNS